MDLNIIIVSHKFLTQPDDDLVIFLNKNKYKNVLHIRHSFSDADDRCSYYDWYKEGKLYKEMRTKDYKKLNELMIYCKEFFFTFKWVMQANFKCDYYIGMDGLCVYFGSIIRLFRKVRKIIFWAIDFVPNQRFNSAFKNKIYHFININGYKKSDEMWDLSIRMIDAREKFLNIKPVDYKKHKVVPYGVWTGRIKKYNYNECEKNTLVFMGHLLPKQGVQLIISLIPEIINKFPNFKFKIIGDGNFKKVLIKLANDFQVIKYCDFLGKIDDIKILEQEVAKSCIAIAPYIKKLDTWTQYTDPGKIKTYLACGVPILLTDVSWNAKEIENNKCGKIITEDKESILSSIIELLDGVENQEYRDNALKYSQRFDYNLIFKDLF